MTPDQFRRDLTFNPGYGDHGVLHQLSSQALRIELQRRDEASEKPVCGSDGRTESYNTPLHVAALFIILVLSTFGMHPRPNLTTPY